jgi:methanethiol S-methyltransferase
MKRATAFTYGIVCYAIFFAAFLYLIGFLANVAVPKSIDSGATGLPLAAAALINVVLLLLFGVQHSVMARPGFKQAWTRIVPKSVERSTYVLFSSLLLILLFWAWQPMPQVIWSASTPIGEALGWTVFASGLLLVLVSTFLIDHFELFGLKQVTLNLLAREATSPAFQVRFLYRFVRHPIYLGWILTFWGTPTMTVGHLLFAAVLTGYILVAIRYEERDLISFHGERYERYRAQTPMLVPRPGRTHPPIAPGTAAGLTPRVPTESAS